MKVNTAPVNHNLSCFLSLSDREKVCFVHYYLRKPYKETARELNISPSSVETYVKRINKKIHVDRVDLFLALLDSGIFQKYLKKIPKRKDT